MMMDCGGAAMMIGMGVVWPCPASAPMAQIMG